MPVAAHAAAVCAEHSPPPHRLHAPEKHASLDPHRLSQSRPWMAPRWLLVYDQPAFWHLDAARGPSTPSFDNLVGAGEDAVGDRQPKRLGGLEVDLQLK